MLGERINQRLDDLGMTQVELARRAKLSPGYVNDLIKGRRGKRLGLDVTQRLGRALKVKPIFFLGEFAYAKENRDTIRKSERG